MASRTELSLDELLSMRHAAPTALAASKPIHGVTHGPFVSKHRGQGIDFDDLRLYSPGDDIRHIDWKVTARYQQAHTRQYREERDSSITFAVDLRRAMYTGTDALRAVSAAHCCAALAWHAVARDQRCAVFVLTDHTIHTTLPKAGASGAIQLCRTLLDAFGDYKNQPPAPKQTSLAELFDALIIGGRQLGTTVLLSGFDDSFSPELKPQLSPALGQLQAKHQRHSQVLSLVQIIDTLETTPLPSGRYGYHDVLHSKTPRLRQLRRTQHAALTAELTRQQKNIEQLCATHNVSHVSHIGPVTAESLAPILHKLSADGVFL